MADTGVQFPEQGGRRSTTATGREAFAVAADAVDHHLARRVRATADWRKDYVAPARDLVAVMGRDPDRPVKAARAGLGYLTNSFGFVVDGVEHPLARACELPGSLATRSFPGGSVVRTGLEIPYAGRVLEGSDLRAQVRRWVAAGVVEPSFQVAIDAVIDNPEWLDLSRTTIVMLGAGAELAPLRELLSWGAQVLAIDLPGAGLWRRVIDTVNDTPGILQVPVAPQAGIGPGSSVDEVAQAAGANLLTDLPAIASWIAGFGGDLVVGNYLYADGATNVRLSMAADALTTHLADMCGLATVPAFLATPTDAFQVGPDVVLDSRERWRHHHLARATRLPLRAANLFQPHYTDMMRDDTGVQYAVADCLVPQQGPNYLLAKRMQRWRALEWRDRGRRVSLNVAPATRTRSVVKNRMLAAAYAGAGRFGLEIFEPATTNALMAALLVRDLRDPRTAADPSVELAHPTELFTDAAAHGGLWRSPFSPRSVLGVAAVVGMIERAA